jgi:hypothetical protein
MDEVARAAGTSSRSVRRAKRIRDADSAMFEAVARGGTHRFSRVPPNLVASSQTRETRW